MKYLVLKEFDDSKLEVLDDIKSKQEEFQAFFTNNKNSNSSVIDNFMAKKKEESEEGKVYCLDVRELGTDDDIASGKRAEFLRKGNVFLSGEEAEKFLAELFKRENGK